MQKEQKNAVSTRINEEYERLLKLFENAPQKELDAVRPLLQNASFLRVTLERLQDAINTGDVTEEYQNGQGQSGRKCSSELQTYNNLIKDYTSIISKVLRLLPQCDEVPSLTDALNKFLEEV